MIKDATSTLTKSQAAAVKKRIEKLNDTLRKKKTEGGTGATAGGIGKRTSRVPDVRDIFPPDDYIPDGKVSNAGM